MNFAISQRELFLNNLTKIIELVNELNDKIFDDDQQLVFAQLNKINPLLDDLTDYVWLIIYNKKREKNEIINIGIDKDKDIEGYVKIYNKIVNDKLEFVNEISELLNNAIEKKYFKNLKDDVLKLIGNSCICDVKRKGCKIDNKEKDSADSEDNKDNTDNDNNDNNGNDNDNYNDNNKLIHILLDNKDEFHNFNDKVLNNLIIIAKLKKEILNNSEKIRAISKIIEKVPKNDLRLKLDIYKKLNILLDDLINHIWRLIYGKNMKVNNEIDNIDCDKVEDAKIYASKYINIVNDKLCLIRNVSDSIEELMEVLNVDTSNDTAAKKVKDFKNIILKWVNKFNGLTMLNKILKRKILKISSSMMLIIIIINQISSKLLLMILRHI